MNECVREQEKERERKGGRGRERINVGKPLGLQSGIVKHPPLRAETP